jgi:hypothetical protein
MKPKLMLELAPELAKELDGKLADLRLRYPEVAEWLTARGHPATWRQVRAYALHAGLREKKSLFIQKVERVLNPQDLAEYHALLKDARTTLADAQSWLKARGYHDIGGGAVWAHRRRFRLTLIEARKSALAAEAIADALIGKDPATMTRGAQSRAEQVLFEQLMRLNANGEIDPKRLTEMFRSVGEAVASRETVESMRRQFEAEKRDAARNADQLARRGASGKEIAERVKDILGA